MRIRMGRESVSIYVCIICIKYIRYIYMCMYLHDMYIYLFVERVYSLLTLSILVWIKRSILVGFFHKRVLFL